MPSICVVFSTAITLSKKFNRTYHNCLHALLNYIICYCLNDGKTNSCAGIVTAVYANAGYAHINYK